MCMSNVSIFTELLPIMVNIILELYSIPLGDRDIIVPFTFSQEQGFASGVQLRVGSRRPLELKSSKVFFLSNRSAINNLLRKRRVSLSVGAGS